MFEYITNELKKNEKNIEFIEKEKKRIMETNDVVVIENNDTIVLIKKINNGELIHRKGGLTMIREKIKENIEIVKRMKGGKRWTYSPCTKR